jgi:hypothetical protein
MEQVSELITVLSRQFTSHPIARNALSILLDSRLDISGYIAARYYFKATGQPRFARLALDAAMSAIPGHAWAQTTVGCESLGERFPHRVARLSCSGSSHTVSFPTLGLNGRFGNQLNQYAFMRLSADAQGLRCATPDWIGRYLFDVDDEELGEPLIIINEEDIEVTSSLAGISSLESNSLLRQRALNGYFACSGHVLRPYREKLQRLFSPAPWLSDYTQILDDALRSFGQTVVAIHVRRGDMVTHPHYWIAPTGWYRTWLRQLWGSLTRPVLYIASDDSNIYKEFLEFDPITSNRLASPLVDVEFYQDWYILSKADVLAISNSSFSFTAAMMNTKSEMFFRPSIDTLGLIAFDPWNEHQLINM